MVRQGAFLGQVSCYVKTAKHEEQPSDSTNRPEQVGGMLTRTPATLPLVLLTYNTNHGASLLPSHCPEARLPHR